jgi:adenosylmethionine-8-amino-7-oxononanoate aminotransferase
MTMRCYSFLTKFQRDLGGLASTKIIAAEHAKNLAPGIMCIGKALSGGFLSFAAILTWQHIAEVFLQARASRESCCI